MVSAMPKTNDIPAFPCKQTILVDELYVPFVSGHPLRTGNLETRRVPREINSEGMTLRDYFAEGAMRDCINERGFLITPKEIAIRAYEVADAMLAERAKND